MSKVIRPILTGCFPEEAIVRPTGPDATAAGYLGFRACRFRKDHPGKQLFGGSENSLPVVRG